MTQLLRHFGPVTDITGMGDSEAVARVHELAPEGITTFVDGLLPRTAMLANALRLPFHSPEVVAILVDKYRQRQVLRRAGLPGPQFRLIGAGELSPTSLAGELGFPIVIKPRTGSGSRETTIATNHRQLADAVSRARAAGIGPLLVEEYLPDSDLAMAPDFGSFVSIESVMGAGRLRHVAVMSKFPLAPPFRESGHFTPSHLPAALLGEVLDLVTAAVRAVGIEVGSLHTEVKLTPAGPRIIEVNGRLGGAVADVLSAAGGCSLVEAAMRVALGESPTDTGLVPCARLGYMINVQPPVSAHRVRSVEGLDELAELPGVQTVQLLRKGGDAVDWRLGTDERVLYVTGTADNLEDLRAIRAQVEELVTITYE
jgi:biotin carboxylase